MKSFTLLLACFMLVTTHAQSGDTIYDAIEVNGTNVNVNTLHFDNATDSQLIPACATSGDIFYKHTVNSGNNKMTIGMSSAGTSVLSDVDYQIFVAPSGDMSQLQELNCDSYTVLVFVGGSFQYVIDDINTTNNYYLRVYKSTDAGATLNQLMSGTTITMRSEYDATLSTHEEILEDFNFKVSEDTISFNNNNFNLDYNIYGIDGKLVLSNKSINNNTIDISTLNQGVYVLQLKDKQKSKSYKFVKS